MALLCSSCVPFILVSRVDMPFDSPPVFRLSDMPCRAYDRITVAFSRRLTALLTSCTDAAQPVGLC